MLSTIILPSVIELVKWPIPVRVNIHYAATCTESNTWLRSFELLDEKSLEAFQKFDLPLLTALTMPTACKEHLRLATDVNQWIFLLDHATDKMDGEKVRSLTNLLVGVLRDPYHPLPPDSPGLLKIVKDLWVRILAFSVPSAVARLLDSLIEYMEAVCEEAEDRNKLRVRGVEDYLEVRRRSVAGNCVYIVCALKTHIPDEVMTHSRVQKLTLDGVTLLGIHNDIFSYNVERRKGLHGHNLVTVVMKEDCLDVQDAINYCAQMFVQTANEFWSNLQTMPSFSPEIDEALSYYTMGIMQWVVGLDEWTFRTVRYFGEKGLEVQKHRVIELAPEPEGREYELPKAKTA